MRIMILAEKHGRRWRVYQGGDRHVGRKAVPEHITQLPVFGKYRLGSKLVAESPAAGYLFFKPVGGNDGEVVFRILVEEVTVSETVQSAFIFTVK